MGRLDPESLVFAYVADRNHTFRYEDAEIISVDARKGGKLIREAWYSGPASLNRHITLHPAFKAIRLTGTTTVDPDQGNNVRRCRTRKRARAGDDTPIRTTANVNQSRGVKSVSVLFFLRRKHVRFAVLG